MILANSEEVLVQLILSQWDKKKGIDTSQPTHMNTEVSVLHSVPECEKKIEIWAGRCKELKKIGLILKNL